MNRTSLAFWLPILAVVCGACGKSSKMTMQYVPELGTVLPLVHKGDVIQFMTPDNKFFEPTFKLGSPCTDDSDLKKGTCTVSDKKPLGRYPFGCNDCEDPEIVVGSDAGIETPPSKPARGTKLAINMGCMNNNEITISPPERTAPMAANVTIHWAGAGSHPLTDWTVNRITYAGNDADICMPPNKPPFKPGNADCLLDVSKIAVGQTYLYEVSAPACSPTPLQGKITIR